MSTGTVILAILIIAIVIIGLIILGLVLLTRGGNTNNTAGFSATSVINNNNNNGATSNFRPVIITKCDIDKVCDKNSSCNDGMPCQMDQCRSLSSVDADTSCSTETCDDSGNESPCNSISMLCNQKDYFTALDLKVVTFCNLQPDQIKDITNDNHDVYAVKKSDNTQILLRKKKGTEVAITSKIGLDRLLSFSDDFYAISGGTLYVRDPASSGQKIWYWYTPEGIPTGIIWLCKTLNNKYLWIQTSTKGYLYNCKLKLMETINIASNIRRFFGRTTATIGDLNTSTNELYLVHCKRKFVNVGRAIFNYNDEIIYIKPDQLSVIYDLRLVLWKPYYLFN